MVYSYYYHNLAAAISQNYIYLRRIAMQYNRLYLPLMQAKTGSWSVGRKQVDTLSWSSPGTGQLVMTETGTFWYSLSA